MYPIKTIQTIIIMPINVWPANKLYHQMMEDMDVVVCSTNLYLLQFVDLFDAGSARERMRKLVTLTLTFCFCLCVCVM